MIKFLDIFKQDKNIFKDNIKDITQIIQNTDFINGKYVKILKNFSKFCKTKYAIGCNSGTDALFLALKSLGLKKILSFFASSNILFNLV